MAHFAIPHDFFEPLGQLAASWSYFECEFDVFLQTLVAETGYSEPNWQRRNFKKRRELFRELMEQAFVATPALIAHIDKVLGDAATVYWKRNVLLHGRIVLADFRPPGVIEARGVHNGRPTVLRLTREELIDLYYDAAHACGDMWSLNHPNHARHLPLSSPDKSALLAFGLKNPIPPPNPQMLVVQTLPSGG